MLTRQLIDLGGTGLSLEGGIKIDVKLHDDGVAKANLPG